MKKLPYFILSVLFAVLVISSCGKDEDSENNINSDAKYEVINMQTNHGTIVLWLYNETPLHKSNFDSLAKAGFYDGLIFHRVIDEFMIQGGDPQGTGSGGPGYTIAAEFNSSLTHKHGAVGAARNDNPEKRSSGSQFYIVENSAGTPSLNGSYTVFGETISGLDVVSEIASVPTNSSDRPLTDVIMTKVEVLSYTAKELQDKYNFTVPK
ncbi:MAG: peptidylprolyl isomerase [Bacteroidales bacterium]|nr:peptidylprolyl isomerase [Bacteroidales bacterium]